MNFAQMLLTPVRPLYDEPVSGEARQEQIDAARERRIAKQMAQYQTAFEANGGGLTTTQFEEATGVTTGRSILHRLKGKGWVKQLDVKYWEWVKECR